MDNDIKLLDRLLDDLLEMRDSLLCHLDSNLLGEVDSLSSTLEGIKEDLPLLTLINFFVSQDVGAYEVSDHVSIEGEDFVFRWNPRGAVYSLDCLVTAVTGGLFGSGMTLVPLKHYYLRIEATSPSIIVIRVDVEAYIKAIDEVSK